MILFVVCFLLGLIGAHLNFVTTRAGERTEGSDTKGKSWFEG